MTAASQKTLDAAKALEAFYRFNYPIFGSRGRKTINVFRRFGNVFLGGAYTLKGAVDIARADREAILAKRAARAAEKVGA